MLSTVKKISYRFCTQILQSLSLKCDSFSKAYALGISSISKFNVFSLMCRIISSYCQTIIFYMPRVCRTVCLKSRKTLVGDGRTGNVLSCIPIRVIESAIHLIAKRIAKIFNEQKSI